MIVVQSDEELILKDISHIQYNLHRHCYRCFWQGPLVEIYTTKDLNYLITYTYRVLFYILHFALIKSSGISDNPNKPYHHIVLYLISDILLTLDQLKELSKTPISSIKSRAIKTIERKINIGLKDHPYIKVPDTCLIEMFNRVDDFVVKYQEKSVPEGRIIELGWLLDVNKPHNDDNKMPRLF